MASRLKVLTKGFGRKDGWNLYWQFKNKTWGRFYSSSMNWHFQLRKNTTDYDTFEQVFLQQQYAIRIPFVPQFIIDGGANIGLASAYFAHRFPAATIIAVEPDKEILNC